MFFRSFYPSVVLYRIVNSVRTPSLQLKINFFLYFLVHIWLHFSSKLEVEQADQIRAHIFLLLSEGEILLQLIPFS